MISTGTQRFVDEIHDHKKELRSSNELLTAFQKSEGKEPCMEGGSNRIKEPMLLKATRKLARTLSAILSVILCSKRLSFPQMKRKWIAVDANPSPGGLPSTQVSMMVTKMIRHHDQDEREQEGSYHWDAVRPVLLKAPATYRAGEFSDNEFI